MGNLRSTAQRTPSGHTQTTKVIVDGWERMEELLWMENLQK